MSPANETANVNNSQNNKINEPVENDTQTVKIPLKKTTTFVLCYTYFALGVASYTLGPSLIDIKVIYKTEVSSISWFFVTAAIGFITGASSGVLFKWLNRQLMIAVFISSTGLALASIPNCPSLYLFWTSGFLFSFGGGGLDGALTVWLCEMWQAKSSPILQAARFSFGLGSITAPIFVGRFVSGDIPSNSTRTEIDEASRYRQKHLSIPFFVNASLCLAAAVLIIVLFCYKKYEEPETKSKSEDQRQRPELSRSRTIAVVAFGAVMVAFYVNTETIMFTFLPAFSHYSPVEFNSTEGSNLLMSLSITYVISKMVFILIAVKVSPRLILYATYTTVIGAYVMLYFAAHNRNLLWATTVVMGIGFAANYPSIMAYLEQLIVMTNTRGTVYIVSIGVLSAAFSMAVGQTIEKFPNIIVFTGLSFFGVSAAAFLGIHCLVMFRKDRNQDENRKVECK